MHILESPALSHQTGQAAVTGVAHAYGATTRIRSPAIICVPISAEFGCWKKMGRLLSLALLLAACCSWAQQPVIASRSGAVDLKTDSRQSADVGGMEWRFHTGDDPQWASPSLSVQSWQSLRFDSDWATQGVPMRAGLAWYRLTVVVPPGKNSIGILLPPIADCYQLFSNGLLVGGMGPMPPHGRQVNPLPAAYTLAAGPRATEQTITIALRVWNKSPLRGGGPNGDPALVGPWPLISNELKDRQSAKILDRMAFAFVALVEGLLGVAVLALFWMRRQDREYLWFALVVFARMAEAIYFIYTRVHPMQLVYRDTIYCCLRAFSMSTAMMFYSSVLRVRRSTFWYIALASALSFVLVGPYEIIEPFRSGPLARTDLIVNVALALLTIPPSVWIVAALIRGVARHDPAAKILLIPALTVQTFQVAFRISRASYQLGWQGTPSELNFPLIREPFPIGLQNCVDVAFVLGVGAFLVRRFTQSRTSEERYGAEMAAAQQVQLRLVPTDLPHVAGFQLEASYFSASEVGGDFYQVVPARDGSLLVVVGDVSGKGLRAAMTGMMAIGALRSLAQRDTGPAEILVRLNQQLVGAHEGGFVTCLCARITPRGEMIVANAGHLSPYLDGVELAVPSGLPLGITLEAEYEEVAAQAPPGSKLTLLSDGVVEATNPAGELLGFERTQQLSKLSAAAIAEAAQAFGQEDDITVLTIQRTADIATFSADFKGVH